MYAEFSQISLLSMSNSELFLVKDDEEGIEFDILKRPSLEFREDYRATASSSSHDIADEHEERDELGDHEDKNEGESNVTASQEREKKKKKKKKKKKICLGELKATDDDDDGFKTPDQKIPVVKQCPAAPRKPKPPPSNKRKASTPSSGGTAARTRWNLQLDLTQEVESLFPRPLLADLHRKVKKARTQDEKQR